MLAHGLDDAFDRCARRERLGDSSGDRGARGAVNPFLVHPADGEPVLVGLIRIAGLDVADALDRHRDDARGNRTAAGLPGVHSPLKFDPYQLLVGPQSVGVDLLTPGPTPFVRRDPTPFSMTERHM